MLVTIKSKKLGKDVNFFCEKNGGYIYTDLKNGMEGSLGHQVCNGGHFSGETLSCSSGEQAQLEKIAKNWFRAYLRNQED